MPHLYTSPIRMIAPPRRPKRFSPGFLLFGMAETLSLLCRVGSAGRVGDCSAGVAPVSDMAEVSQEVFQADGRAPWCVD